MAAHKHIIALQLIAMVLASQFSTSISSAESDANSVEIKLYPAALSDWPTTTENTFKATLSEQATTYCGSNPSSCGLDSSNSFTSSEVTVHSKSESSRSLKLSVYIEYPANSNVTAGGSTTQVLPQAAVKEILKDARDSIKTNIDMYITYIGSDYYGIPPVSTTNGIIIPIAAVTVVAVGISAVVMVYLQEREEKRAKLEERQARKRRSKTLPNYDIAEEPSNALPPPANVATSPRGAQSNSQQTSAMLRNNYNKTESTKTTTAASEGGALSVNHFHHNGTTTTTSTGGGGSNIINNNTLPPLASPKSNTTTTTMISTEQQHYHYQQQQQQQQQQQHSLDQVESDAAKEEKRRRKKEKKREKKRLLHLQQQQHQIAELELELHDNQGFDTSGLTASENSAAHPVHDPHNIPTFTMNRGDSVA